MAALDLSTYDKPVSEDEPCGPDLEEEGDLDFMNFMAAVDGRLSGSFFEFDRGSYDFDSDFRSIEKFSESTRDIRLLVTAAKLSLLNRNIGDFAKTLELIAELMENHWETVNPKPFDGDHSFRLATLSSLDDMPMSILPLTYAPVVQSRRLGPISYHSKMVAEGEAEADEGEPTLSLADVQRAMAEADEEMAAARDSVGKMRTAVATIRKLVNEHCGYDNIMQMDRLPELIGKLADFIGLGAEEQASDEAAEDEDAGEAPRAAAGASLDSAAADPALLAAAHLVTIPAGAVGNQAAVAAALDAIDIYYTRYEPSSPAVLLIRQARRLVGRSFLEALEILAPQRVNDTIVQLGGDNSFVLPVNHLKALAAASFDEADLDGDYEEFEVRTRADAVQLMVAIESYYRAAEPSSAIPMLITRARNFASKDFVSLLGDFLPQQSDEEAAASIAAAAAAPAPAMSEPAAKPAPKPAAAKPAPAAAKKSNLSAADQRAQERQARRERYEQQRAAQQGDDSGEQETATDS